MNTPDPLVGLEEYLERSSMPLHAITTSIRLKREKYDALLHPAIMAQQNRVGPTAAFNQATNESEAEIFIEGLARQYGVDPVTIPDFLRKLGGLKKALANAKVQAGEIDAVRSRVLFYLVGPHMMRFLRDKCTGNPDTDLPLMGQAKERAMTYLAQLDDAITTGS